MKRLVPILPLFLLLGCPGFAGMKTAPAPSAAPLEQEVQDWHARAGAILQRLLPMVGRATEADVERLCGPADRQEHKGRACLCYKAFQYSDDGVKLPKGLVYEGAWDLDIKKGVRGIDLFFDKEGRLESIQLW